MPVFHTRHSAFRTRTVTLAEAIQKAAETLTAHNVPNARLDAELLLRHALGKDRAWLLVHMQDRLDDQAQRSFEQNIERRKLREPLQYITGTQEFWGLPFMVTPDVLIPRPETEFVVEAALKAVSGITAPVIVDLCTGSGCIAISIAKELATARIFATDRSERAVPVAQENARRNGVADRIRFLEGDLFGPLEEMDLRGRIDVIVTNPPYVRSGDLTTLQPEVRDFEPEIALVAGPEGTEIAERIIHQAPEYLKPGGSLIMEMGVGQASALRKIVEETYRFGPIEIVKDLAGIERVLVAKKQ
ncbi:MAG: peptide chain release factor N(5)-glutamine methyltransferase [Nitrospirota bacterium]